MWRSALFFHSSSTIQVNSPETGRRTAQQINLRKFSVKLNDVVVAITWHIGIKNYTRYKLNLFCCCFFFLAYFVHKLWCAGDAKDAISRVKLSDGWHFMLFSSPAVFLDRRSQPIIFTTSSDHVTQSHNLAALARESWKKKPKERANAAELQNVERMHERANIR